MILTSFKLSIVFGGSWGSTENWLEPKTEPPSENLACPNLWNALLDALLFVQTEFSVQILRKMFNWTETCFTVLKCSQTQWAVRHESTTIQLLKSQLMLKSLKQFSEITSSSFFREKNEVFAINDVTVSVLLFPRKRLLFTRCVCCHFLTLLRSRTPFRWGDWRAILY